MIWQTTRFQIDLTQPRVMGIVNVTPDSFSDGGAHASPSQALRHAEQMLKEGADILDVGGESTRPGSPPVPLDVELERVMPLVQELVKLGVPVSVDTYKPEVMAAVLDLGVDIINDIWALRQPGAESVVANHGACGVCLMHMHRDPQSMQVSPMEGAIVGEVASFLGERANALQEQGVHRPRIALDPGVGFGKTVAQNFSLLSEQEKLLQLGYPLLVGWSRKSSLGAITGVADPSERTTSSVAAALLAAASGAHLLRVHDVRPTVEALSVLRAVRGD